MKYSKMIGRNINLIDILLALAVVGILTGIIIVIFNPGKLLVDARNAQRRSDVNTILNIVHQYSVNNNGDFPVGIDTAYNSVQILGTDVSSLENVCGETQTVIGVLDMADDLTPVYIENIPQDPKIGIGENTGYYINLTRDGNIVVGACYLESGVSIEVTR